MGPKRQLSYNHIFIAHQKYCFVYYGTVVFAIITQAHKLLARLFSEKTRGIAIALAASSLSSACKNFGIL